MARKRARALRRQGQPRQEQVVHQNPGEVQQGQPRAVLQEVTQVAEVLIEATSSEAVVSAATNAASASEYHKDVIEKEIGN